MLIDVHAHLNDERLLKNLNEILKKAREKQVEKIICVGYDLDSSKLAIEIAEKNENVFASIGIHPSEAESYNSQTEKFLLENFNNKKVVSIGEIGLDYHYEPYDKELQKKVFEQQIKIADKAGLPIQVHSRDATKDTLDILNNNLQYLKKGGIVHCFSGSYETLLEIQKLGFKVSLGGDITFKNARNKLELIEKMSLEMLTLETDCPYLCPEPHRGQTNEPQNVYFVAQKIADIKGISVEEVAKISTENAIKIFKI